MSRRRRPSASRRRRAHEITAPSIDLTFASRPPQHTIVELVTNGGPAPLWWWRVKYRGKPLAASFAHFKTARAAHHNVTLLARLLRFGVQAFPHVPKMVKG